MNEWRVHEKGRLIALAINEIIDTRLVPCVRISGVEIIGAKGGVEQHESDWSSGEVHYPKSRGRKLILIQCFESTEMSGLL